jgi:hypothetical protein
MKDHPELEAWRLALEKTVKEGMDDERTCFHVLMTRGTAMQCIEESIRYLLLYLDDEDDQTDLTAIESSYALQERAKELMGG